MTTKHTLTLHYALAFNTVHLEYMGRCVLHAMSAATNLLHRKRCESFQPPFFFDILNDLRLA